MIQAILLYCHIVHGVGVIDGYSRHISYCKTHVRFLGFYPGKRKILESVRGAKGFYNNKCTGKLCRLTILRIEGSGFDQFLQDFILNVEGSPFRHLVSWKIMTELHGARDEQYLELARCKNV
jgi:hypothetical protein